MYIRFFVHFLDIQKRAHNAAEIEKSAATATTNNNSPTKYVQNKQENNLMFREREKSVLTHLLNVKSNFPHEIFFS